MWTSVKDSSFYNVLNEIMHWKDDAGEVAVASESDAVVGGAPIAPGVASGSVVEDAPPPTVKASNEALKTLRNKRANTLYFATCFL